MPPTAYIKMIDAWLLFSLFKPFVDIIVQTYIETLRIGQKEPKNPSEIRQVWALKNVEDESEG